MSRPTLLTPELMDEVCDRISEGRGLREVANDEDIPSYRSLCRYIANDANFAAMVERARENAAYVAVEEIKPISDEECADNAGVGRNRNRIEARTRLAEKLHPRRFAPRGVPAPAPEAPKLPDEGNNLEIARSILFLLAKGGQPLGAVTAPEVDPFEAARVMAFVQARAQARGEAPFVPPFDEVKPQ